MRPIANYGPIPTRSQSDSDTEPQPFGPVTSRDDTAKRCYICGRGDDQYQAGLRDGADRALTAVMVELATRRHSPEYISSLEYLIRQRLWLT